MVGYEQPLSKVFFKKIINYKANLLWTLSGTMAIISHGQTMNVIKQNDGIARWRHYNAVIYWMSKEF